MHLFLYRTSHYTIYSIYPLGECNFIPIYLKLLLILEQNKKITYHLGSLSSQLQKQRFQNHQPKDEQNL